jgi:hypothetical protein
MTTENICKYCKKEFSYQKTLLNHQKTAKYCIKIQQALKEVGNNTDLIDIKNFSCAYCDKIFTSKSNLDKHTLVCVNRFESIINEKDKIIDDINYKYQELLNKNTELLTEIRVLKEQLNYNDPYTTITELQEKLQEIALASIDQKNELISGMIKKYVKKQPRPKFDEQNVIYIITTQSLKKDRRYILGKAKNLTNRLSTYNKTDEHEVVYYQDCGDEDNMNFLEPLVFKKLNEYREQANRERFILPEDKNIDFFIDTIKKCFEFLK